MLPRELFVNEILPLILPHEIYNFSVTCIEYLSLFSDDEIWQIKCQRDLPGTSPIKRTWREHYLGKKIPLYEDGDRIGYLYYNYQTRLIFPASETLVILIYDRTPYLQVIDGSHALEVFTDTTIPLDKIDRAIIYCRDIPLQHTIWSNQETIWSNRESLEGQIYEQIASYRGTPPIYGYHWATHEQGHEKPVEYFTIIDRRYGRHVKYGHDLDSILKALKIHSLIDESLSIESTEGKMKVIIAELKRIGHLLSFVFI